MKILPMKRQLPKNKTFKSLLKLHTGMEKFFIQ